MHAQTHSLSRPLPLELQHSVQRHNYSIANYQSSATTNYYPALLSLGALFYLLGNKTGKKRSQEQSKRFNLKMFMHAARRDETQRKPNSRLKQPHTRLSGRKQRSDLMSLIVWGKTSPSVEASGLKTTCVFYSDKLTRV